MVGSREVGASVISDVRVVKYEMDGELVALVVFVVGTSGDRSGQTVVR
jgi:hypothetical protein